MIRPDEVGKQVGLEAGDGLGASRLLIDGMLAHALHLTAIREDGFRLGAETARRVITSDVFSVDPLIFPGSNIGALAAIGVCNDLLASGAHISEVALGIYASAQLEKTRLRTCLESFNAILETQGASVVCGDTKVHPERYPELLLFATALGNALSEQRYDLIDTRPGDDIIITGPLGSHAIAVLSAREGLGFDSVVTSDAKPLNEPIEELITRGLVHSLRDLTRGGLTAALWDGYESTKLSWFVQEEAIPVQQPVQAAAEMLGLDTLTLTNEGCMLITAARHDRDAVLDVLRACPHTAEAIVIGTVQPSGAEQGPVLKGRCGTERAIILPYGIGIPRLC